MKNLSQDTIDMLGVDLVKRMKTCNTGIINRIVAEQKQIEKQIDAFLSSYNKEKDVQINRLVKSEGFTIPTDH